MRRVAFFAAGIFLIFQSVYTTYSLYRSGAMFILVAVSPALLAAFALGWLLVLRNFRSEDPPTTPEEDS